MNSYVAEVRTACLVLMLLLSSLAAACSATGAFSDTFTVTMPAQSMEPTIKAGSRVTVTRVEKDFAPQFGQIVLFDDPGDWLGEYANKDGMLLKRVIGVAGDTVTCCDEAGRIAVNGNPIDEPYIAESRTCAGPMTGNCNWTAGPVPSGTIFVLGDNREHSADSSFHLCLPNEDECTDKPWVDIDLIKGTVDAP